MQLAFTHCLRLAWAQLISNGMVTILQCNFPLIKECNPLIKSQALHVGRHSLTEAQICPARVSALQDCSARFYAEPDGQCQPSTVKQCILHPRKCSRKTEVRPLVRKPLTVASTEEGLLADSGSTSPSRG